MTAKGRWGLVAGVALAGAGFLFTAARTYRLGFPLDDAWIFQTYARHLAQGHGWVYVAGRPSAGATAPLWVMLQVPGVWLRLTPLWWPWLLGGVALVLLSWLGSDWWARWAPPESRKWAWAAGLLLAWEWHLVWAAFSGMETLLFALGALAVLRWVTLLGEGQNPKERWLHQEGLQRRAWFWGALGWFIGGMVWLRPEAMLLGLPVGMGLVIGADFRPARALRWAVMAGLGFALPVGSYLLFNYWIGGHWWPNTFYAKQAEYAALLRQPWWWRVAHVTTPLLAGPAVLLLPGWLWGGWQAWQQRRWTWFAGPAWAIAHIGVYALRLPVGYQHGRYVLPVLPVGLLWGLWGLSDALGRWRRGPWRVLGTAWALGVLGVTLAFLPLGAWAYGRDVAVIESQMVDTARWVATHTAKEALVAAHDIGALGYFADRPLLDLAGLVSPEVVPWLGDPQRLAGWVRQQRPAYLVDFVGDYPLLEQNCRVVFRAEKRFVALFDRPPMQVCRFRW
ncbi:MAG TPA: hypothetical protein G4O04_07555 [Anaerolineae bacterium]|nr:hypothetical protein [Anaerolineae bacterium]HID84507.1 hypothetical protein [Anaerolineales bacterium]HIQ08711.1 hypothetical protein [Anaerolineaceae bacterium]